MSVTPQFISNDAPTVHHSWNTANCQAVKLGHRRREGKEETRWRVTSRAMSWAVGLRGTAFRPRRVVASSFDSSVFDVYLIGSLPAFSANQERNRYI